jgi:hypothetical protein
MPQIGERVAQCDGKFSDEGQEFGYSGKAGSKFELDCQNFENGKLASRLLFAPDGDHKVFGDYVSYPESDIDYFKMTLGDQRKQSIHQQFSNDGVLMVVRLDYKHASEDTEKNTYVEVIDLHWSKRWLGKCDKETTFEAWRT